MKMKENKSIKKLNNEDLSKVAGGFEAESLLAELGLDSGEVLPILDKEIVNKFDISPIARCEYHGCGSSDSWPKTMKSIVMNALDPK